MNDKLIFTPKELDETIRGLSIRSVRAYGRGSKDPYGHIVLSDGSVYDLRVVGGATLEGVLINIVSHALPIVGVHEGWAAPTVYEMQIISQEKVEIIVRVRTEHEMDRPPVIVLKGREK